MDTYVRITGEMKSFNNKRHIGSNHIMPIKEFNEIPYHFLEAVSVHLMHTRGATVKSNGNTNGSVSKKEDTYDADRDERISDLSPFEREVFQVIKTNGDKTNEGAQIHTVQQNLTRQGNLMEALSNLKSMGVLYETIDEEHVCTVIRASY